MMQIIGDYKCIIIEGSRELLSLFFVDRILEALDYLKVLNLTRIIDSQLPVANEEFQTVSVEN
jgi:hypothetical protein